MAYCVTDDVSLGSMELPRGINVQSVIDTQAEFIDSTLGRVYKMPLRLQAQDPQHKPFLTLLKKLNIYMALGEIILKAAGARQDSELNAYGKYYTNWAERILNQIESGKIKFPDQKLIDDQYGEGVVLMVQKDTFSRVEEFYVPDQPSPPWQGTRQQVFPWA